MGKIKKVIALLKKGEIKSILRGIKHLLCRTSYQLRARYEDWRLGRISLEGIKATKFKDIGAKATQSSNYEHMDQIFKAFPYPKKVSFVDVGCGEGRVLTYLYLRGCRVKMTGIELDPDIAETARKRTEKCPNIQIHCGNVLDCKEIIRDAGAIYLCNPFTDEVLIRFIEMIEENCHHPVVLYYCNDIYRHLLDKRQNWTIIWRNRLTSRIGLTRTGTIYGYKPETRE